MPEEIGIALLVLIFVGWVVIKLVQVLAEGLSSAHKELGNTISRRSEQKFSKKKNRLAQHVRSILPNQLEQAVDQLNIVVAEFNEHQRHTAWNPQRPVWTRKNFAPYILLHKNETWHDMDIQGYRTHTSS